MAPAPLHAFTILSFVESFKYEICGYVHRRSLGGVAVGAGSTPRARIEKIGA